MVLLVYELLQVIIHGNGMGIVADFIDQHLEAILFIERDSSAICIDGEEAASRSCCRQ